MSNTNKPSMYARREASGLVTMRQERYRAQLEAGNEHPHDVCAWGRDVAQLKEMAATYNLWPDADYSAAIRAEEDAFVTTYGELPKDGSWRGPDADRLNSNRAR